MVAPDIYQIQFMKRILRAVLHSNHPQNKRVHNRFGGMRDWAIFTLGMGAKNRSGMREF